MCEIDDGSQKAVALADTVYAYYNRFTGIVIGFAKKDRGNSKIKVAQ